MTYPLSLNVAGRRCVVVGGGPVAARRVVGLLDEGADVLVVAPWAVEEIAEAATAERLTWRQQEYAPDVLDGAWLVHTATGDRDTDDAVAADSAQRRVWCVRADDAAASSAWTPAVRRRGALTVAVTADGDPRRSVHLAEAVALLLDSGDLPQRHQRPARGTVALVGGGPGDPDLITVRGRRLLAQADVVVVDRLGPRALLDTLDADVEVIEAGKAPHAHTLSQDEINAVLIDRARQGRRVVRLKGGDPFVLGRGSEEAAACVAAGIPVEVVPGVTSAVAVPAAAGIPVTHRGVARSFTVLSAHEADPDWSAVAALDGTVVLLMGVARLREVARHLVAGGRRSSTPVAVVERGTFADQRTTVGTLADIADRAEAAQVVSPAVIVVGDVVDVRAALVP